MLVITNQLFAAKRYFFPSPSVFWALNISWNPGWSRQEQWAGDAHNGQAGEAGCLGYKEARVA